MFALLLTLLLVPSVANARVGGGGFGGMGGLSPMNPGSPLHYVDIAGGGDYEGNQEKELTPEQQKENERFNKNLQGFGILAIIALILLGGAMISAEMKRY